jgi:hypothetical protein
VPLVTAYELGDPVTGLVAVVADDRTLHPSRLRREGRAGEEKHRGGKPSSPPLSVATLSRS